MVEALHHLNSIEEGGDCYGEGDGAAPSDFASLFFFSSLKNYWVLFFFFYFSSLRRKKNTKLYGQKLCICKG